MKTLDDMLKGSQATIEPAAPTKPDISKEHLQFIKQGGSVPIKEKKRIDPSAPLSYRLRIPVHVSKRIEAVLAKESVLYRSRHNYIMEALLEKLAKDEEA